MLQVGGSGTFTYCPPVRAEQMGDIGNERTIPQLGQNELKEHDELTNNQFGEVNADSLKSCLTVFLIDLC